MNSERAASVAPQAGITFRRYDAPAARERRDTVQEVYLRSYVEAIDSGHSFDSVESFMTRFDAYTTQSGFDLVVAYQRDGTAMGQTWGWPLGAHNRWWTGLDPVPEPDFTREDGRRTFALSEIMIDSEWAGQGIAHALHDELLSARAEERATLLVEPENVVAARAYRHWGWRKVAQLRPAWDDAPLFDVLMLALARS